MNYNIVNNKNGDILKIKGFRSDLYHENNKIIIDKNLIVNKFKEKGKIVHIIKFNKIDKKLKNILKKEIKYFLKKVCSSKKNHIFVIGLGNDFYTADSVGPKTVKKIKVNGFLSQFNIDLNFKVSALSPGVLGSTGIKTELIIKNVVEDIKPNIIILIDSFVTENIDNLNGSVEISNRGLTPGSGLGILNFDINENDLKVPIITIGIPVVLELKLKGKKYHLSADDIDIFIEHITDLLSEVLNELFYG